MYNSVEAAEALGVTARSVHNYTKLKQNPLKVLYVGMKKAKRFREDDLKEFAEKNGISIIKLKQ